MMGPRNGTNVGIDVINRKTFPVPRSGIRSPLFFPTLLIGRLRSTTLSRVYVRVHHAPPECLEKGSLLSLLTTRSYTYSPISLIRYAVPPFAPYAYLADIVLLLPCSEVLLQGPVRVPGAAQLVFPYQHPIPPCIARP